VKLPNFEISQVSRQVDRAPVSIDISRDLVDRWPGRHAADPLCVVFCAGLLLTGCGTAPRVGIQRVAVPAPVECKEPVPARPVMPTESLGDVATLDQFAQAAMAEIERREGYEVELRTALVACTAPLH
jgi:hypothetical protein